MPTKLTVGELALRMGARAELRGPLDARVESVRIVSDAADIADVQAGSALVLTGTATSEPWRLERALRLAWERAVACVVISGAEVQGPEPAELAERLGLAFVMLDTDVLDATVRLSAIIATDEASEAGTLAEAARGFGVATASPSSAIATLRRLLPDYEFALLDQGNTLIAGARRAADTAEHLVALAVPFPDKRAPARLVGVARSARGDHDGKRVTALTVARLAVAPLTAWAATRRLAGYEDASRASAVLAELLAAEGAPGKKLRGRLAALGWPLDARFRVAAVHTGAPRTAALDELLLARLADLGTPVGAAPHGDGWVAFLAAEAAEERRSTHEAATLLAASDPRIDAIAVGVSTVFQPNEAAATAIEEAVRAAQVALNSPDPVLFAEDLTPAAALPALLSAEPDAAARALLAPLLEIDRDGTLLATLVASLDHSDRPAQVAQELGVHRNTVTARLERVRGLGLEPANPAHRLAIHVAARRILDAQARP
ncbi:helix-turn-helix domain-containing protein [Leucobacter komagatae]|uniref:PucR-like helix-turn-helix protein n=1 Tax=Leucobacter komagatae TaxID=55969 RepID=A0A0D0IPX2_9MICO|nr:helix-turn-helix domain-containing protein [Leucobacter komagatae]KIP51518.1 hypothetical protein SD72_14855 [Leucobacter komagatae]